MSNWNGDISVDIWNQDLNCSIRMKDVIEELIRQFPEKSIVDIMEFFGVDENDIWSKQMDFEDIECSGTAYVDKDDIEGWNELEQDNYRQESDYLQRYDQLVDLLKPISDWYYIEGGRDKNDSFSNKLKDIVKKLNL